MVDTDKYVALLAAVNDACPEAEQIALPPSALEDVVDFYMDHFEDNEIVLDSESDKSTIRQRNM